MADPPTSTINDIVGTRDSLLVIRDPQLAKTGTQARAQLRSLPFLTEFDFQRVIHPAIYDNGLRFTQYDHLSTDNLRASGVDNVEFPVVHYVTQESLTGEYQDEQSRYDDQDILRRLLQKRPEGVSYVLVTDSSRPEMPRYTKKPGKSFVDEFECTVIDYKGLLKRYLQQHLDSALPLSTTQNLYYHQISAYHKQKGLEAGSIPDLFAYTQLPAESPAWDPLYYFIRDDADRVLDDYSERIREALRSWTERGPTQKIANSMLDMLEHVDFEETRLDDYRYRHQETL